MKEFQFMLNLTVGTFALIEATSLIDKSFFFALLLCFLGCLNLVLAYDTYKNFNS